MYTAERIMAERVSPADGARQFLVRWEGYTEAEQQPYSNPHPNPNPPPKPSPTLTFNLSLARALTLTLTLARRTTRGSPRRTCSTRR